MKTPLLFIVFLFGGIYLNSQISSNTNHHLSSSSDQQPLEPIQEIPIIPNYKLHSYSISDQQIFEPTEEVPFVTFSIGIDNNNYYYLETKVCKYRKYRIDGCLCKDWEPVFYISELLEESGEECQSADSQLFEQEYFNNFAEEDLWYFGDYTDDDVHYFHITHQNNIHIVYTKNLMGINEQNLKSKIQIFPIPSKEKIYFSETIKKAAIFDITGKLILKIESPSDNLNISNLPEGNYIIKGYKSDNQFFQNKFIKK